MSVTRTQRGAVTIITMHRPAARNAVDRETAQLLVDAMRAFEADADSHVAILTGQGGTFCAGADLKAIARGTPNRLDPTGDAPMGPSRLQLSKPVIAAIEGHAVAGGLELALWCDLRVMAEDAILGVFCRRFGVPLIDGGAVRLPRLIGESRALDLILTGRAVHAAEALAIGLVNRVAPSGKALEMAHILAATIADFPQACLRADRATVHAQHGQSIADALADEFTRGLAVMAEATQGAARFAAGEGRHGG